MSEEDDTPPTREELIDARDKLKEQIARVANPIRFVDQNPALVAKLQAMLDEINAALEEHEPFEKGE